MAHTKNNNYLFLNKIFTLGAPILTFLTALIYGTWMIHDRISSYDRRTSILEFSQHDLHDDVKELNQEIKNMDNKIDKILFLQIEEKKNVSVH